MPVAEKIVPVPKALRTASLPDPFTRSLYACAPYRGCGHGCRYCDGRAEKYYFEGDFEKDLEIRAALPDALARELPALRDRGIISLGSGVTDCYQPLEAREGLTRRCIPAFAARGWPVLVMTKSALALRDLDAWTAALVAPGGPGQRGGPGFLFFMTVTGTDEPTRELMECGASPYRERLEALSAYARAGATTGALAMPLLPGLSDDDASVRRLFGALKETGVSFIMPGGLTLRPGRQKEAYLQTLRTARPDLLPLYDKLYAECRPSGMPIAAASAALAARCGALLRETGLPDRLPHRELARLAPAHDAARVLLRDMVELYGARGVPVRGLAAAADRYDAWLKAVRTEFRRRRTLPASWLEERFLDAAGSGELARVLDNAKLSAFMADVALRGLRLDYATLKSE